MSDEMTQGSESTATETAASSNAQSTATENTNTQTETASSQSEALMSQSVPNPYTPNFKFKVMDQEKEFDEWLRPVVKDAETEKKIRELYEKAHGLDYVKSDRQKIRSDFESLRNEYVGHRKNYDELSGYLNKGDFDKFFQKTSVPEAKIFEWVYNRLNFHQKPEHEKAEIMKAQELEARARELEEQNQYWQTQYQTTAMQQRTFELQSAIARPEVASIAQQFDARMGPGAFQKEVIARGAYYASVMGQDVPVQHAINDVVKLIGGVTPQTPMGTPQTEMAPAQAPQAPEKKPVIPNIQGRGTSPARRTPSSLADLKRMREEMSA